MKIEIPDSIIEEFIDKNIEESKIQRYLEIIKNKKDNENSDVFNEEYEKYRKELENYSGGLVTSDKGEFLKYYAFYSSFIQPIINKYVDAFLGKKVK